jgi:hypothetical protein
VNFNEQNMSRLARGIAQCQEVCDVPRRLGGDATDKELADDKRTARRVGYRLMRAQEVWRKGAGSFKGSVATAVPDGSGARLIWSDWWEAWREQATELRQQADERWQQHAIDRELEGIASVLGDLR